MTSSINPNNIDGAYPVAGQDNNSQGFRDNFTNTKTNFQYAADEITDLQNKVVLKQALTGTTLDNNMLGSVLSNAQLQDMSETRVALSVSGTGTITVPINYAAGSYQTVTTPNTGGGTLLLAFSNWPAAGAAGTVSLELTVTNVGFTLTLPAAVSVNALGIQGINSATNVITFAAVGVYTFTFVSSDGGTTITVNETNQTLRAFNNTGDDVTNTGACSLATCSSKFNPTGAWTATLAAGVLGQVKELILVGNGGSVAVTVTNAGWKTSGTGVVTLSTIGDGCILRYANNKWYCVGNNGGVFS
jgi:hypothetical protein